MIIRCLSEAYYQKIIQKSTNGYRKALPSGITDVTTRHRHIEIKKWNNWKFALGQILAYDFYDKKEALEVHMFGEYPHTKKMVAKQVFDKYNIMVIDLENEISRYKVNNAGFSCLQQEER